MQNSAFPQGESPASLRASDPSVPSVPESVREGQLAIEAFKKDVEAVVKNDSLNPLDRLPILRQIKEERKLKLHDSDIRKMMHDARRKGRASYEPITSGRKLKRTKSKWLWEGLIMAGQINIVLALAKTGKTLLVLQFLAALINGEESFLGRKLSAQDRRRHILICGPDMNEADWAECLDTSSLLVDEELVGHGQIELLTAEDAFYLDDDGIDFIAGRAQQHQGLIVLLDSYTKSMEGMGYQDKDTSYGDPLSALADAVAPHGATVIVIHHVSKGNRNASPVLAGRGSMRMAEIASWVVKLQFLKEESAESSSDGLISGPRKMSAIGRGRSNELVAEMDRNGKWINGQSLDVVVRQLEEEQQKAALLKTLNDRQKEVLKILKSEWLHGDKTTVEMVASSLFGAPPNEDSKRKARATLDQLKDKGLIGKDVLIEDYGQFTVYWPMENEKAEGLEGTEGLQMYAQKDNDECLF